MEDPDPYASILLITLSVLKPFSFPVLYGSLSMILLLFASALISGSEVAFFSLEPKQLDELKSKEDEKSQLIMKLLERPKYLLATVLISNNFVNIAIVILSTYISQSIFNFDMIHPWMVVFIQVVIITSLLLIFGEIMPKMIATQYPVRFARFMVRPMNALIKILFGLSKILVKSTSFIDKRFVKRTGNLSRDELSEAIAIASDDTSREDETKILKGIVRFGDIQTSEIMTARLDVTSIEAETSFQEVIETIVKSGYSRIPVYEESFDKISGILYVKDLLPYVGKESELNWGKFLRQPFFVPENKPIDDLLREFQEKKIHLAIVVDEYGGTSGIVSLEDILEEIVGEITDETDSKEDLVDYEQISENIFIFEGKTSINDFCKIVDLDDRIFDAVKGDADSLAGIILEKLGKIPLKGTKVTIEALEFQVEMADKRRIIKVKITIPHHLL